MSCATSSGSANRPARRHRAHRPGDPRGWLIRADTDLLWARRAYHGLLDAAIGPGETETDPDLLAARIVDTLLHGIG